MINLYLADLKGLTEDEVKQHISNNYAGTVSGHDYGEPSEKDKQELLSLLGEYNIVIAYESVGNWGCDSSSWFLLRHKNTGVYYEFSGSHCSCYGFEGQFELNETPLEYLKSDKFYLGCGGYDDDEVENRNAVKQSLSEM